MTRRDLVDLLAADRRTAIEWVVSRRVREWLEEGPREVVRVVSNLVEEWDQISFDADGLVAWAEPFLEDTG